MRRRFPVALSIALPLILCSHASAEDLIPGVDYVPGQILMVFAATSAPDSLEVTSSPAACGIDSLDCLLLQFGASQVQKVFPYSRIGDLSSFLRRLFVAHFPDSTDLDGVLAAFGAQPDLEYVGLNRIYPIEDCSTRRVIPDTTTAFDEQWHLDGNLHFPGQDPRVDIDAPEAWAIERGDPSVVVGVLDTGMMLDTSTSPWRTHSDFNFLWLEAEDHESPGSLTAADFSCSGNFTDDDGDGVRDNILGHCYLHGYGCSSDPEHEGSCPACDASGYNEREALYHGFPQNWQLENETTGLVIELLGWNVVGYLSHGVRVASVAASRWAGADAVGVAPLCKVYPNRNTGGEVVATIKMFDEVAQHCDVINMSWTVPQHDPVLHAGIIQAASRNCVLVAAVGNGAAGNNGVKWPARYPEVLAVGAITKSMTLTTYSQYNFLSELVDVVAPVDAGVMAGTQSEDTLTVPIEERVLSTSTGTSFAAPQAAGVAALIKSRFPGMRQYAVRDRIKRSAQFYWNQGSAADRRKFGSGKINAYRAVTEWGSLAGQASWRQFADAETDTLVESRNGEYYVSGDLTVESGSSLTISPGTVVKIAPDYDGHEDHGADEDRVEIVVEGTLTAIGTPGEPIIFESFTDTVSTASDWVGIRFVEGSRAVLKNVIIRNASSDIVIDEFSITEAGWDSTKTLVLNSLFEVTDDLTVAAGEDLYVLGESEVVVTGGSDVDITVNGSLVCKGSATKKPLFRSSTAAPRSWGILTLASGSSGHVVEHVNFRDADLAIRSYVPLSMSDVTIRHGIDGIQGYADLGLTDVVIDSLTGSGVVVRGGDLSASGLEVAHVAYGITNYSTILSSTITCTDSWFHDLDEGIFLSNEVGALEVRRSTFEDCLDGLKLGYQADATVDSCTIRNNDIGLWAFLTSGLLITNADFDSNATTGLYLMLDADATVESSTIQHSPAGVTLIYGAGGSIGGQTKITGNDLGIKCEVGADPTIASTWITGNVDGVAALNGGIPNLGYLASNDTCVTVSTANRIHDNSGYHVTNLTPSVTIAAEGNWWGDRGPLPGKFSGAVDYYPYDCDTLPPFAPGQGMAAAPREELDAAPGIAMPTRYELAPNQPNPFNPTTGIRFDVPPPGGAVRIDIFDVAGRRVTTLVDGYRAPGTHEVRWNGESARGEPVSSGVYFVRMQAATFTRTRKAVLLK